MTENHQKRCIIIDDEPASHYILTNYIKSCPNLLFVQSFYNGIDALQFLKENPIDLIFLDIEMPELNGIDMLKILPIPVKTILTTAYSEYALESYEYGVIDYLLKPIPLHRFLKAIDRFLLLDGEPLKPVNKSDTFISVKIEGYFTDIKIDDINYIQSYGNYVRIYTAQKMYLASITTSEIQQQLPQEIFKRVHKSYIVSVEKINHVEKDFVIIGQASIPVGITYKSELKNINVRRKDN